MRFEKQQLVTMLAVPAAASGLTYLALQLFTARPMPIPDSVERLRSLPLDVQRRLADHHAALTTQPSERRVLEQRAATLRKLDGRALSDIEAVRTQIYRLLDSMSDADRRATNSLPNSTRGSALVRIMQRQSPESFEALRRQIAPDPP